MTTHVKPTHLDRSESAPRRSAVEPTRTVTRIGRTFRFESAHRLPNLPDGHRCKNLHGHNYRVEVVIAGAVDDRGFVLDFAEIDAAVMPLIRIVDHRLLNDVEGLENPTAEVIAAWFLQRIDGCERVRVYENDDCWAEVSRESNS
jgi:6-pyruvoyltetrahydropterin/6-carboxytetrahydropterin synthase